MVRALKTAAHPISDDAWAKAMRISRELDRILESSAPVRGEIGRAAAELRMSTRQVYNYLARYRDDRRVSSLLPRTDGTRQPRISKEVEDIIATALRDLWLRPERPDLAPIVDEIRARCASKNFDPPAYVTVAKRIAHLFTPEEIARRRLSDSKHLRRLKPRPGYIRANHALEVVQIDHTPADIQFVEVIDDQGVFVVLVGEVAVFDAVHDTDEMGSRFDTVPIPRWGYDEDFAMLLDSLDASMPLERASGLSREPLAKMIHDLSEGLIGEIVDIVARAAVAAIVGGEEQITGATLSALGYVPLSKRRNSALRNEMT